MWKKNKKKNRILRDNYSVLRATSRQALDNGTPAWAFVLNDEPMQLYHYINITDNQSRPGKAHGSFIRYKTK